jgi:predicted TPR repeat methyltransferase
MSLKSSQLKPLHLTSGDAIADRRFAYASAAFVDADWSVAVDLATQTLELTPQFAPAYALLGRSLAALGRRDEAVAAFNEALGVDPDDALGIGIDLAKLGAADPAEALSESYVRTLFDQYASSFDSHLTAALAYRGPQVVRDALEAATTRRGQPMRFNEAIDLGCGTGLMGVALDGVTERLTGVDLSPAMLAAAARTGRYAALTEASIVDALEAREPASVDLLLAADVLVYVGDLFPVMREAARALKPGGLFVFTVQAHAGHGFALGVDSRFAHSEEYLEAVADDCGLAVVHLASVSTRQERGLDVPGFVMVLART